jgi:hypothetical protein
MDHVYVFACKNQAETPCMVFVTRDLDKPVPRPKANNPPKKHPKESDPNTNEEMKKPEKRSDGPSEWQGPMIPRKIEQNHVRTNIFRVNEMGNITVEGPNA